MTDTAVAVQADSFLAGYRDQYKATAPVQMSLLDYLNECRTNKMAYATPAERMLKAIGEPEVIDTRNHPTLSRIFQNRKITAYKPFADFYGMEDQIAQVVGFFRSAAQGLEEKKQILYLLGPVGSAKSTLAERIKGLMQVHPIYRLGFKHDDGRVEPSPVNESPLGMFNADTHGADLRDKFGIPTRYLEKAVMSPWAAKRLAECDGDLSRFVVERVHPSIVKGIGISRTEPGDENNQDVTTLIGKVDIRKMERFPEDDTDAYSYSGGLCRANQGLLEFVEMFKAPIKVLHPLLTATQDGQFKTSTEAGMVPFSGIIIAHSNESEWTKFKNNKDNEAFLDRVFTVTVPYSLRMSQEVKIYEKLIDGSQLAEAPCAPQTMELLAKFAVLSRAKEPEGGGNIGSKIKVYDGENLKDTDPRAKSHADYKKEAGPQEGMDGLSTRWAFKTLSQVFNFNAATTGEVEANPIHLFYVLQDQIDKHKLPGVNTKEDEAKYNTFLQEHLIKPYVEFLGKEVQTAYLESYSEYGQNIFDRYVTYADYWIQDTEYRDTDTGESFDKASLNAELEKIEKPVGIANPKDFRNEVVNYVLRQRANNNGNNPAWTSYEKLRTVIEKKMFSNTEDLLPVISFNAKSSAKEADAHKQFVDRMGKKGYTPGQTRLAVDFYMRHRPTQK